MRASDVVQSVMFDYETLRTDEIAALAVEVPRKVLRWLAAHHPHIW